MIMKKKFFLKENIKLEKEMKRKKIWKWKIIIWMEKYLNEEINSFGKEYNKNGKLIFEWRI
jgi:hypothetical protein